MVRSRRLGRTVCPSELGRRKLTTGPTPDPQSGWTPAQVPSSPYPGAPTPGQPPQMPITPPQGQGNGSGSSGGRGKGLSAGLIVGVVAIAVVSGFLGGVVSHAAFPAKQGPQGVRGPAGQTGPAGSKGPAGPVGNVDTSTLGYCIDTSTETLNYFTPPVTVVTSVNVYAPTITNGTQSCPTGSFEPLSSSP